MKTKNASHSTLILILGSLTALSPFSIDMYLAAFPQMAQEFNTSVVRVSLTLSSYFIGLASGQLFYGPLMDRFGRLKPLYLGLMVYIAASLGCAFSNTIESLIILRFIQAIGGCAASVAAFAMVRDLFDPKESAKVFSLLILILGVSPLLAPTIGGFLAVHLGWPSVFIVLGIMALIMLLVVAYFLPESHIDRVGHTLHPVKIVKTYIEIIREPQFYTYAFSGSIAFAGLFVYLAASPTMFMEIFKVSEQTYGWIFAIIAMGLVGMSQLNIVFLKKYSNETILLFALLALSFFSLIFIICAHNHWYNLSSVVLTMFLFLACVGLANPNSSALAMAPFAAKAGSAAALLGFLQMGIGALASVFIGVLKSESMTPFAAVFVGTSLLSLIVLFLGEKSMNGRSQKKTE